MHDERRRIEERVERVHNQRIKPAIYAASVPLDVAAWQAPGEPVPFTEAAAAAYAPFTMDTPWGPPWGTTWFRMSGRVPRTGRASGSRRSSTSASWATGRVTRPRPSST